MPRGNVGEWSELYALAYLLVHGGAFDGDEEQNPIPGKFHSVFKTHIVGRRDQGEIEYQVRESDIAISVEGSEISLVPRSLIESVMGSVFAELASGKAKRTFSLESGDELLSLLKKSSISASSGELVYDLELELKDEITGASTPRIGFSIKSQIGGRSTLLNASGATNFIYKIVKNPSMVQGPYPHFTHGKHTLNLRALYAAGYCLEFEKIKSQNFENNLTLLDMQFPRHLSKVLLESYLTGTNSFADAVNLAFPEEDPMSRQPVFKMKEFLGAVAMGLRPSVVWDGDTTRFSGIIVVKSSGELLFYYLSSRKNFEEYLYKNVAFEKASTSRHQYGSIFRENGDDFVALNLQIRFKN